MEMKAFVFSQRGQVRPAALGKDDPMKAVNHFALRRLTAEEVALFTMDLCNNQVDRHFSRFPEKELERINGLTPGRPLMERHDLAGSLPRGTFFRSRLHRDGDYLSVPPEVYVLRSEQNKDFILNIEGGVYRETSIAFSFRLPECSVCGRDLRRCSHVPGRSYGDKQCHFIMRDVLEVLEGSVVPAGSQGTRFVAQERGQKGAGLLEPMEALCAAREAYHQPITVTGTTWALE
ncbi:MAG: hypothetical protein GX117_04100 [Candidatus Hydrogenedentes bacterium]|nr:hypothetical protein [Candidatus Hydrogenedentota bacterium]